MIVVETANATVSASHPHGELSPRGTQTAPSKRNSAPFPPARIALPGGTLPVVLPEERGDEQERNQADFLPKQETPETIHLDGEASRIRSELARDLLAYADALVPLIGDIAFATKIQLLRRGLARCHDLLKDRPSESACLSIVTLVESALSQLKWKQCTPDKLGRIRQVLELGYSKARLEVADCEKARRLLAAGRVETVPRIDWMALSADELEDGEANEG